MHTPPPRRRDITVSDVARRAQVSKATAARALGDYGAVSEAVRDRVRAAAEALDYRPNELARSMNTGKSNTIGVIVGDIENPYFGLAMRGISDGAKELGFDVILVNTGEDVNAEVDAVRVLLDKRVDGLIVAPASSLETKHLHEIYDSGRPLVLLDRRIDGLEVDVVEAETESVAYHATQLLTDSGHQRIAFISAVKADRGSLHDDAEMPISSVADRLRGVLAAQGDAAINDPEELVRFCPSDEIASLTRELMGMAGAPTAIIASDSLIALSILRALRDMGLRVPDDVSFISFDDFEWTALVTPPLTVISQPIYEMGLEAARTVVARIQGRALPSRSHEFEATLIQRESVASPRTHELSNQNGLPVPELTAAHSDTLTCTATSTVSRNSSERGSRPGHR